VADLDVPDVLIERHVARDFRGQADAARIGSRCRHGVHGIQQEARDTASLVGAAHTDRIEMVVRRLEGERLPDGRQRLVARERVAAELLP
jgi:hypothetical protein